MTQKRMGKEFEKIIRTRRGMSELAKALDQISRDTNQGGEFEPCCTSFKEAAKKMHPGCLLALYVIFFLCFVGSATCHEFSGGGAC